MGRTCSCMNVATSLFFLFPSICYNVPPPSETARLCTPYHGDDKLVLCPRLLPREPSAILEAIVSELSTLLSQSAPQYACTE